MNQTETERLVNPEAELGVIGLFLSTPASINVAVRDGFNENYIFGPNRKAIAECIMKMHGKRQVIDLTTVTQQLRLEAPMLDAVTETTYCLDHALASQGFLTHYIEILRELYHKRSILECIREQEEQILTDTPAIEISSSLIMEVSRISADHVFTKGYEQMVEDMMTELESGACAVVPCRQELMRRKIGGFPRGKPTVIAARPGTGKSTFMCNEIDFMVNNQIKAGVLSLEMTREELLTIMVCERMGISAFDLKRGNYDFAVRKEFGRILRTYESKPLWVADRNMTINQIVSWVKTMKAHHDLDIVFLDYIQRIRSTGKMKRYDEVSQWAHMLTDVCKDTGVALVELAQISRAGEAPPGVKEEDAWKYVPKLHHLKETGALEEDAYLAILLYPVPGANTLDGKGLHVRYTVDVAKHRGGPVGHIDLVYYKDHQRFAHKDANGEQKLEQQPMFSTEPEDDGDLPF